MGEGWSARPPAPLRPGRPLDPVVPEWLDRQLAVAVHQARLLVAAEGFRVKATEAEVLPAEAMVAVFPGEVMVAAGMEDE